MKTTKNRMLMVAVTTVGSALLLVATGAQADEESVKALLKKSDCFKCHAVDKTKKGPSYKKIAAKYKGKADGEEKAIKNFTTSPKVKLEDGTEEEHKVLDTKDMKVMKEVAQWILSR